MGSSGRTASAFKTGAISLAAILHFKKDILVTSKEELLFSPKNQNFQSSASKGWGLLSLWESVAHWLFSHDSKHGEGVV